MNVRLAKIIYETLTRIRTLPFALFMTLMGLAPNGTMYAKTSDAPLISDTISEPATPEDATVPLSVALKNYLDKLGDDDIGAEFYLFYDPLVNHDTPLAWSVTAYLTDKIHARSEQLDGEIDLNGAMEYLRRISKYDCQKGFGYDEFTQPSGGRVEQFDGRVKSDDNNGVRQSCKRLSEGQKPSAAAGLYSVNRMLTFKNEAYEDEDKKYAEAIEAALPVFVPDLGFIAYETTFPKAGHKDNGCTGDERAKTKYGSYDDYAINHHRCRTFVTFKPFKYYTLIYESGKKRPRYLAISGRFDNFSRNIEPAHTSFATFPDRFMFDPVREFKARLAPNVSFSGHYDNRLNLTDSQLADMKAQEQEEERLSKERFARASAERARKREAANQEILGMLSNMVQQQALQRQAEQAQRERQRQEAAEQARLQAQREQTAAYERQQQLNRQAADQRAFNDRRAAAIQAQQAQQQQMEQPSQSYAPPQQGYQSSGASQAQADAERRRQEQQRQQQLQASYARAMDYIQAQASSNTNRWALSLYNRNNFRVQCTVSVDGESWAYGSSTPFHDSQVLIIASGEQREAQWSPLREGDGSNSRTRRILGNQYSCRAMP